MIILTRLLAIGLVVSCVSTSHRALAGLVISFSDDGGASFSDSFSITQGESLNIGLYLRQTDGDTVLTDQGLFSWGLDLTSTSSNPTTEKPGSISSASVNPVYDVANHDVTTTTGLEWEHADSSRLGIFNETILLGSLEYSATDIGTTLFTIEDRIPGPDLMNANWFTPSFSYLDEQIFGTGAAGTYQFSVHSVSAVPEPSSLLLFGVVACAATLQRRRVRPFRQLN